MSTPLKSTRNRDLTIIKFIYFLVHKLVPLFSLFFLFSTSFAWGGYTERELLKLEDGSTLTIERSPSGKIKGRNSRKKLKELGLLDKYESKNQQIVPPDDEMTGEEYMEVGEGDAQKHAENASAPSDTIPSESMGKGITVVFVPEEEEEKKPEKIIAPVKTGKKLDDPSLLQMRYSKRKVQVSYAKN